MKTRITKLLGIKYPVILSGMSWISIPKLVAAVSEAGGLGIIASGVMTAEETLAAILETKKLTKKPFGANITLYFPGAKRNAKIIIDNKVPVVNYALGKGDWICKEVHKYGGKVVATVTTLKHALAAQRDGADALIVTGHEAAGHGGAVTSLVLIPSIAEAVDIPVIGAGGFADGKGLAAAFLLGAEGVAMGTRFMNTAESPVHESQKEMSNKSGVYDTVYSDKIDGLPARMLNTPGARRIMKKRLNPLSALVRSREISKMLGFPWGKLFVGILLMGPQKAVQMARMAVGFKAFQVGTMEGDNAKGVLPIGQVTGLIHDTPKVKDVLKRLDAEAAAALKGLSAKLKGTSKN